MNGFDTWTYDFRPTNRTHPNDLLVSSTSVEYVPKPFQASCADQTICTETLSHKQTSLHPCSALVFVTRSI